MKIVTQSCENCVHSTEPDRSMSPVTYKCKRRRDKIVTGFECCGWWEQLKIPDEPPPPVKQPSPKKPLRVKPIRKKGVRRLDD